MAKMFTIVELQLIRDSLVKVTPARQDADRLWEVIEKVGKLIERETYERAEKLAAEGHSRRKEK